MRRVQKLLSDLKFSKSSFSRGKDNHGLLFGYSHANGINEKVNHFCLQSPNLKLMNAAKQPFLASLHANNQHAFDEFVGSKELAQIVYVKPSPLYA